MNIRSLGAVALLAGAAATLSACSTIRDAAGMDKSAPDEFAVLTKAPLVIPPDYNLRPPRPGAVPTNQIEPTQAAQMALFGNDPATIASQLPSTYSESEKMLLANAGIQNIDPQIREHLASDHKSMLGADEGFTNDILFWQKPAADTGTPLDADKEARRMDDRKAGQTPGAAGPKPATAPKQEEDKGWLDGWFDWF
jgi:hypothetical protein